MSGNELTELLKRLGFTGYEAKAYITLVLNGPLTATELASRSEIPQPRVYDVVQSLIEKGLILVSEGRPRKFRAVDPETSLTNYMNRKRSLEEETLRALLLQLSSSTTSLEEPGVWTSTGLSSAQNLIEESADSARDELLFSGYLNIIENLFEKVGKKEISTCIVLYDAIEEVPERLKVYDEVRIKPTKAPIMLLPDFRHALVIVDWESKRPTSYLVTDENLIKIFAVYYLNYIRSGSKLVLSRFGELSRRSYVHLSRALDHVKALQKSGKNIKVHVWGRRTSDGTPIELQGEVLGEFENSYRSIGYLRVKLPDGREITVGGIGAYLEDVEARRIEIISD